MVRLLITTIIVLLSFASSGQERKEFQFYSYIQRVIGKELKDGDSLVIDQLSNKCFGSTWQAVIKLKGDSCNISFYPDQLAQDTTPTELIKPLNSFTTSRNDFIAGLEEEKNVLKNTIVVSYGTEEFFLQHHEKIREFKLQKAQGLYYRLRFNKSWADYLKEQ